MLSASQPARASIYFFVLDVGKISYNDEITIQRQNNGDFSADSAIEHEIQTI